jgi:hypothetical protein
MLHLVLFFILLQLFTYKVTTMFQPKWLVFMGIMILSLCLKCAPYLTKVHVIPMEIPTYFWSFSPEMALSIYCGLFLRNKPWMLAIPLGLRILSDGLLAYLNQEWIYLFYPTQFITYTCLLLLVLAGTTIPKSLYLGRVALTSLGAAIIFFLVTNGSIWLWGDRQYYAYSYDLTGLMECYTMALPFFRNSLVSTVFFSCVLCSPLGVGLTTAKSELETSTLGQQLDAKITSC